MKLKQISVLLSLILVLIFACAGLAAAGDGALGPYGPTSGRAILGGAFTHYNNLLRPGVAQVFASMGANPTPLNLLLLKGN